MKILPNGGMTFRLSELAPDVQAAVRDRAAREGKNPRVLVGTMLSTGLRDPETRKVGRRAAR